MSRVLQGALLPSWRDKSLSFSATWERRAGHDGPARKDKLVCTFQQMVPVNVKSKVV